MPLPELARLVARELVGSILEADALDRILSECEVDMVSHLVAPRSSLTHTVYNVGAFNPSAEEVRGVVVRAF